MAAGATSTTIPTTEWHRQCLLSFAGPKRRRQSPRCSCGKIPRVRVPGRTKNDSPFKDCSEARSNRKASPSPPSGPSAEIPWTIVSISRQFRRNRMNCSRRSANWSVLLPWEEVGPSLTVIRWILLIFEIFFCHFYCVAIRPCRFFCCLARNLALFTWKFIKTASNLWTTFYNFVCPALLLLLSQV